MGRKRKTRWRHLSIGEVSANEEEDDETEAQQQQKESNSGGSDFPHNYRHHKSHSLNSIHRHRSASLTFKDRDRAAAFGGGSKMSSAVVDQAPTAGDKTKTNGYAYKDKDKEGGDKAKGDGAQSGEETTKDSAGGGGETQNHRPYNGHYSSHRGAHSHYNSPHQYHNGYHHHSYDKDSGGGRPNHHQNGYGEYSSNSFYHRSSSYNNYRNSYHDGSGGGGHHGGRGGGSDYHYPSRYSDRGGRYRGKPRPYSSYNNGYYGNGNGNGGPSTNGEGNASGNTPSYNQEEYTKITTPRQDVLFKKGYLSQRKTTAQSSSLESTSTPTTPSASTNGTPDTHSTAGIHSDYSEGYEIGETDGSGSGGGGAPPGVPPPVYADDTVYYGPPATEAAVFTDPHTGQVYYGQCSSTGEFFDAYPVSPVMLACPNGAGGVYYQLAYPPPLDWNGVPQLFPLTMAPAPIPPAAMDEAVLNSGAGVPPQQQGSNSDATSNSNGSSDSQTTPGGSSSISAITKNISKIKEFRPAASASSLPETDDGGSEVSKGDGGTTDDVNSSSPSSDSKSSSAGNNNNKTVSVTAYSTNNNTTTTKAAINSLSTQMSNLNMNSVPQPHQFNGPHSHGQGHGPPLPQLAPLPNYMASVPVRHHQHQHHHHQQHHLPPPPPHHQAGAGGPPPPTSSYMYPHPAGFMYAAAAPPPIYNGVVVPIAPPASSSTSTTNTNTPAASASCSRKKLKKRRRDHTDTDANDDHDDDDAQLTDESFEGSDGGESNPEPDDVADDDKPTKPYLIDPATSENEINQNPTTTTTNAAVTVDDLNLKINNNANADIKGSKKPSNLTGLCPLFAGETSQDPFSLQISPTTLEPGSPDSFNTTQSVAGSEVVGSVSASDDLMNRTTSIDEVEEDLPNEDEPDLNSQCETTQEASASLKQEILPTSSCTIESSTTSSVPVPNSNPITIAKSQSAAVAAGSNEPSPSPESTFERQIEPPSPPVEEPITVQQKSVRIPLESLYPNPALQLEEKVEEEQVSSLDIYAQKYEAARELQTHSLEKLHSVREPPIILKRTEPEPQQKQFIQTEQVEQQTPSSSSSAGSAERPKSITLAVTEWLKTQGEDALTPAAQIVAQFTAAAIEDNDGDIDSEDEEGQDAHGRDRDGESLTDSEENQKNAYGNPWVLVSSSKRNRKAQTAAAALSHPRGQHQRSSTNYRNNNWYTPNKQHHHQQHQRSYYYSNQQQQTHTEPGPRRDSRDYYSANAKNNSAAARKDGTTGSRVASSSSYHNYNNNRNYNPNRNSHYYGYGKQHQQSSNPQSDGPGPASSLSLNLGARSATPNDVSANSANARQEISSTRKSQSQVKVDEEDSGLDLSSPEHHTPTHSAAATDGDKGAPVFPGASNLSQSQQSGKQEESSATASTTTKKKRKGNSNSNKNITKSIMDDKNEATATKEPEESLAASLVATDSEPSESINCDPQNYAKYYQFGVVVLDAEHEHEPEGQDEEDMKDQGIGSGSSTPTSTPPQTPKIGAKESEQAEDTAVLKSSSKKKKKKKNSQALLLTADDERQSFINMSTAPVDMSKVMKTCDFYETKMSSILMKSKSANAKAVPIAVQEEDEEIGTFDPNNLKSPLSQKDRIVLWKGVGQMAQSAESSTPPEINEEDYNEFVQSVLKKNASASSTSSSHPNLYVNPLSLAAELVYTANANKVKLPDSWDVTEPPLPVYESPPSPNLLNYPPSYSPVFSHLTPREKLIRTQLTPYGFPSTSSAAVGAAAAGSGNPVSTLTTPATQQAVCCNIQ